MWYGGGLDMWGLMSGHEAQGWAGCGFPIRAPGLCLWDLRTVGAGTQTCDIVPQLLIQFSCPVVPTNCNLTPAMGSWLRLEPDDTMRQALEGVRPTT